jgi:hypothetical protein
MVRVKEYMPGNSKYREAIRNVHKHNTKDPHDKGNVIWGVVTSIKWMPSIIVVESVSDMPAHIRIRMVTQLWVLFYLEHSKRITVMDHTKS